MRRTENPVIAVRICGIPPNGDCSVVVSTADCESASQGSNPAVTLSKRVFRQMTEVTADSKIK